ncbi:MAG: porin family protein, partial [Actinomycetota bacterium]|nr:porin family protein [Actinomycetota bacterium]
GILATIASPARADGFISPFIGFNFGGDSSNCATLSSCEEKRLNWGASLGSVNGVLGFEEEIGYASQFFGKTPGGDNAMLTLMSNLMIVIPAGPIQPYGIIGIGLMRSHAQFNASSLALDNNSLGWDIGGGLSIFLAHSIGVRGDVRRLRTLQDVTLGVFGNDKIDFWRASAGLVFRF